MKFFRRMSLVPRGLRYKLMIAFCLMSIIPLLAAAYIVRDYIFPPSKDIINVSWLLLFCLILAILGLILIKHMIESMIEMALETKLIAKGDLERRISVDTEDEIGDLGQSINQLTLRIRENMEELSSYGEKTKDINTAIHKRVLALSSLLQIGENISRPVPVEDIMNLIVDKIVEVMESGYAMLFLPKSDDPKTLEVNITNNVTNDNLRQLKIKSGRGILGVALASNTIIYTDSKTGASRDVKDFKEYYDIENFAAFPITSRDRSIGMLLVGNELKDFKFKDDDVELIKVFLKQAALAYEHSSLIQKAEELAIKDDLTNLYNKRYITARLDEEIRRALVYQRPCSYIIFDIDDFRNFRERHGELVAERTLRRISSMLRENVTQVGKAARLSGNEFALLLPEKNKKEAYTIAEDVRKKIEKLDLGLEKKVNLTVSGGVSENPIDGSTAEELIEKAVDSVSIAKSRGKNKIV